MKLIFAMLVAAAAALPRPQDDGKSQLVVAAAEKLMGNFFSLLRFVSGERIEFMALAVINRKVN